MICPTTAVKLALSSPSLNVVGYGLCTRLQWLGRLSETLSLGGALPLGCHNGNYLNLGDNDR